MNRNAFLAAIASVSSISFHSREPSASNMQPYDTHRATSEAAYAKEHATILNLLITIELQDSMTLR